MSLWAISRKVCPTRRQSARSLHISLAHQQSATNPCHGNIRHFSAKSPTRSTTGTSNRLNTSIKNRLALFGLCGSMAVTGTVYCKTHPSFLTAFSEKLLFSESIMKRCLCAQSTELEKDLPGWTDNSKKLYQQYCAELLPKGWTEIRTTVGRERNQKSFSLNHPDVGSTFEYVMFCKEDEQRTITIMQFGEKTQGPAGYVHGGAIATAGDICAGVLINSGLHVPSLTASLTVNYKRPIPLGATVVIETHLDRVERRKHFLTSTFKSVDGSILYDIVTTLFIEVHHSIAK